MTGARVDQGALARVIRGYDDGRERALELTVEDRRSHLQGTAG
jgi:hypothetical protein